MLICVCYTVFVCVCVSPCLYVRVTEVRRSTQRSVLHTPPCPVPPLRRRGMRHCVLHCVCMCRYMCVCMCMSHRGAEEYTEVCPSHSSSSSPPLEDTMDYNLSVLVCLCVCMSVCMCMYMCVYPCLYVCVTEVQRSTQRSVPHTPRPVPPRRRRWTTTYLYLSTAWTRSALLTLSLQVCYRHIYSNCIVIHRHRHGIGQTMHCL